MAEADSRVATHLQSFGTTDAHLISGQYAAIHTEARRSEDTSPGVKLTIKGKAEVATARGAPQSVV